ncbi:hypothetical protein Tco_0001683 [Tanacetum coccineum]
MCPTWSANTPNTKYNMSQYALARNTRLTGVSPRLSHDGCDGDGLGGCRGCWRWSSGGSSVACDDEVEEMKMKVVVMMMTRGCWWYDGVDRDDGDGVDTVASVAVIGRFMKERPNNTLISQRLLNKIHWESPPQARHHHDAAVVVVVATAGRGAATAGGVKRARKTRFAKGFYKCFAGCGARSATYSPPWRRQRLEKSSLLRWPRPNSRATRMWWLGEAGEEVETAGDGQRRDVLAGKRSPEKQPKAVPEMVRREEGNFRVMFVFL